MNIIHSHVVSGLSGRKRFSEYAVELFADMYSRKRVKNAIKNGELLLNGEAAETGRWICNGDRLEMSDGRTSAPAVFEMAIRVLHEDENLAVVYKPAGIVVNGNRFRTMENALGGVLNESSAPDSLPWPRPVHRLDASTSGLLLVAKTAGAAAALGRQFEERSIDKIYLAVVAGTPSRERGVLDGMIDGRDAVTEYAVIKSVPSVKNGSVSLVELRPATGRTHQLRLHLSRAGHPIMGDRLYGEKGNTLLRKGLFLAAVGLSFIHPVTGKTLDIRVEEPVKFGSLMEREERRWKKYNS